MKKLIVQTILFLSIVAVAIMLLSVWSGNYVKQKLKLTAKTNVSIIVTGHSHAECAFNDMLIQGLQNFSKSGESYFYTYYKLLPLLEQNPQIKTVLLEFSNDVIIKEKDEWIWDKSHMSYLYPHYGLFIDKSGKKLLRKKNPKAFFINQGSLIQSNIQAMINRSYDYTSRIGKYIYLERNQTDSLLAAEKLDYIDTSRLYRLSENNLEYLRKIVDLCKSRNLKIYLVRSPLHPASGYLKNEYLFNDIYLSKFQDVEYLDFKNFPLENSEYGNLEHLNYKGAIRFSKFVNSLIEKGLLHKPDKQRFIYEEMLKYKNSSNFNQLVIGLVKPRE